jgi:hypothetical protein
MSPNSVVAGGSATLTVTAATLSAAPRDRGHQKMSWWEHLLRACRSGWWLVCLARQSIPNNTVSHRIYTRRYKATTSLHTFALLDPMMEGILIRTHNLLVANEENKFIRHGVATTCVRRGALKWSTDGVLGVLIEFCIEVPRDGQENGIRMFKASLGSGTDSSSRFPKILRTAFSAGFIGFVILRRCGSS